MRLSLFKVVIFFLKLPSAIHVINIPIDPILIKNIEVDKPQTTNAIDRKYACGI